MEGIKLDITGNIARVIERPDRITAGTVGLPVEFTFDSQWDGLTKTAVFRVCHESKIVDSLETNAVVPWELLRKPGAWLIIGVYGVNEDGSVAIPTIWARVCAIIDGADPEGDPGADPSLPVYQKLLDDVDDIEDVIDDILEIQNELMNGSDIEVVPSVHLEDTSNPHGVTAEQVGARPDTWMPTAEQVGAANDSHRHTVNDVDGVALFVYPVGSIYMSVVNTNPSTLFGGVWERLKDSFLLGAGDTYEAGATGGEAKHTLTIEEMPNHGHSIGLSETANPSNGHLYAQLARNPNSSLAVMGPWQANETAGGDFSKPIYDENGIFLGYETVPHNNMPPYLAVYMWKRTA